MLSAPDVAITDADRHARLDSALDPNDWRVVSDDAIGLRYAAHDTQPLPRRHAQNACSMWPNGFPTACASC